MLCTITRLEATRALQVKMDEVLTQYNTDNSTSIKCFYDNVVEKVPNPSESFLRFTINFSSDSQKLDGQTQRQVGIAVVQVCTPLGQGSNESASISDAIEGAFTRLLWAENVMEVTGTGLLPVGPDGSNYVVNVNIYFQYNKG